MRFCCTTVLRLYGGVPIQTPYSSILLQLTFSCFCSDVLRELQPRSAALKDPQARREVELRLKGLARQGQFITEASRQLEEILTERGRAW